MKSKRIPFLILLFAFFAWPFVGKADFQLISPGDREEKLPDSEFPSVIPEDSLSGYFDYAEADTILRMAVVLSDIYSKKDMEFTRGMLMGMQNAGLPANSVSLKIVNGEIPEDSLQYELELFGPHLIVSTYEKDSPRFLRTYVQETDGWLLNIFDARNDDYLYNENVFQILAPSERFNAEVSSYITSNFAGSVLVLIGDPDPTDSSVRDLIITWPEEDLMILSKEDMSVFELEEGRNYLIYPLFTSVDDVKEVLGRTVRLASETPDAGVRIFGRPNWIALNDLSSLLANMEAFIPVKCYFDPVSDSGRKFIASYNSMFGHAPIRSYPVYAVMGYDTSRYFIPEFLSVLRGGSPMWVPDNMDQSYFNLEKMGHGGHYNRGGYILHFEPWGTMTKDLIP